MCTMWSSAFKLFKSQEGEMINNDLMDEGTIEW